MFQSETRVEACRELADPPSGTNRGGASFLSLLIEGVSA
jgi:hypothetical protein